MDEVIGRDEVLLTPENILMPEIDFAWDDVPNLPSILKSLRKHGPAVPIKYWDKPTWLILDHADVDRCFHDQINFNIAEGHVSLVEPVMGHNVQCMSGEEHRQHRGLINPLFMPRAVRSYVERLIEPVAHELLDRIEGKQEVDFVPAFAQTYPFTVITRLLGIPVKDEQQMMKWAVKILEFAWDYEGGVAARDAIDAYLRNIIEARRRLPLDDLLSAMMAAEFEGKKMDDEEILTFARLLFPAGSDTTYKNFGGLFYEVFGSEVLRERAKGSDADRQSIVSESLRLYPPIALQIRMATGAAVIGDAKIKHGDWCLFGVMSANRDPLLFPDPDKFDPSRDNRQLITFGRGTHFCLGMHLARRELECALKIVLERFPDIRLAPAKPVEFVKAVFRGPRHLWVQPYGAA